MPGTPVFLYVEESENDVLLMKSAIAKAALRIQLCTVSDGEDALRYLNGEGQFSDRRKHPVPTLMLLEINLPKKDGFQVLQWLRQQPQLKRMVAIVLTSSRRQEDVDRAYDLGANAVVVKPTTIEELVEIIGSLSAWMELTLKPRIDVRRKT